jgi:hypothetical protein
VEILFVLAALGAGGWLVRGLLRDAGWHADNYVRGSASVLVPELPSGSDDAPLRSIETLRAGERAAVIGTVVGSATLVSPVTRRLCMAYDLSINNRMTGDLVTRLLRASAFEVDDGTGRVTVEARGAYVRAPADHHRDALERDKLDAALSARIPETVWIDLHEGVIAPGARVLVIGEVQAIEQAPDAGAGYRRNAPPRLRIGGSGETAASISAVPDDLARYKT